MGTFKANEAILQARGLAQLLARLSDDDLAIFDASGALPDLVKGIFDATKRPDGERIGDYLLRHKPRATLAANLRLALVRAHTFRVVHDRREYFLSPNPMQPLTPEAVYFLEGEEPFAGYLGVYRKDGTMGFAILNRDIGPGQSVDDSAFDFITADEVNERMKQRRKTLPVMQQAIDQLKDLLQCRVTDENEYQKWFQENPWSLGLKYESIEPHKKLDDKNVPDYLGVRVSDKDRDLFEIEQPFKPVLTKAGDYCQEFNQAWNQAERYRTFAYENRQYLGDKGLRFVAPQSILIYGYNLGPEDLKAFRDKSRANPHVQMMTYNDVIAYAENTVETVRCLSQNAMAGTKTEK